MSLMDSRWNRRKGSVFDFNIFETDLCIRVEWACMDNAAVADLDLSCAVYDRRGECLDVIDFSNLFNANHSIELRGDSIQSKVGQDSSEEVFIDLDRLPKRVKAMVLYASSLSGSLHTVSNVTASIDRMRFAEEITTGKRIKAKWETSRVIDQRPIWEGKVEITNKQAHTCNTVGLFKLVREKDRWTAVFDSLPFFSINQKERLRFSEQHMLVNVFPWLKTEEQRVLPSIKAVCAALSSMSMPALKPAFLEDAQRKAKPGLTISEFVKVLFRQLVSEDMRLTELNEATHVVALLHELFRQIDVNGDGQVDWDEFTSYCIEEGVISTNRDNRGSGEDGSGLLSYTEEKSASCGGGGDPMDMGSDSSATTEPVIVLLEIRSSRRVVAVEQDSVFFKLYNTHGGYIARYTAEGCQRPPRDYDIKIYDVAFVPERSTLCLSCSDQTISLVLERHEGQSREPKGYVFVGKLIHNMLPRKLTWSPAAQRLLSAGATNMLYVWDLDLMELVGTLPTNGAGMLLEMMVLKDKGLIATSFLDGRIHLWSEDNFRPKGVLEGHRLGVRTMAYAQNMLISGGFEFEMLVWDVSNREQSMTLKGHKHPIVKVGLMAAPAQKDELLAVSCDEAGDVKIWDLIHTTGGHAQVLQTFSVPYIDAKRKVAGFIMPYDQRSSLRHFSNIIFASGRLSHFVPKEVFRPFVPPRLALLNQTSMRFIVSIGPDLHMWEATTGRFYRIFAGITPAISGITCGALDSPKDRRLFIGDEGGNVLLVNTINGTMLNKVKLHEKEVTNVAYCGKTGYIISTGADGRLCMASESKGTITEVRVIEQAHACPITCLAYSQRLSVIATSAPDGHCHLWDFQTGRNATVSIRAAKEICALLLMDPYNILLTGDNDGAVVMWQLGIPGDGDLQLLRRLTPGGEAASAITSLNTLCEEGEEHYILAANESGEVMRWSMDSVLGGLGIAELPDKDCPGLSDKFNPHMKATRNLASYNVPSIFYDSGADITSLALIPSLTVHAHLETIPMAFTCLTPAAFITVSNDGYLRVWSPDMEPVGELILPGADAQRVTDRNRFMDKVEYKFGKEDVEVSLSHKALAQTFLVERVTDTSKASTAPAPGKASPRASRGARSPRLVRSGTGGIGVNFQPPEGSKRAHSPEAFETRDMAGTSRRGSNKHVVINVSFMATNMTDMNATSTSRRNRRISAGRGGGVTMNATARATMALTQLAEPPSTNITDTFASLPSVTVRKKSSRKPGKPSREAFSSQSLMAGAQQGFFDMEAIQLLSIINKNPDRQVLYDQEYPWTQQAAKAAMGEQLESMRRSASAGASRLDLSSRYQNVASLINQPRSERNPLFMGSSSSSSHLFRTGQLRHNALLEQLRVDSNVNSKPRIYTCERMALTDDQILGPDTVQIDGPLVSTASILDCLQPDGRSPSPDTRDQWPRFLQARTPINEEAIAERIAAAMAVPDLEIKPYTKPKVCGRLNSFASRPVTTGAKKRRKELSKDQAVAEAIRPGALGPYYTLANVMQFRELFNKVDQDLNGTLSSQEWELFLKQMSHKVPEVLGRKLFYTLDRDRDGTVTMAELVPIIFNRATPFQHQMITKVIEFENSKMVVRETLSKDDIIKLFEYTDEKKKGFLTFDELVRALNTLQVAASKTQDILDTYKNDDHLFQKKEFVELVWPLVW